MNTDPRSERLFMQFAGVDDRRFVAVIERERGRRWRVESNGYALVARATEEPMLASESGQFMKSVPKMLSVAAAEQRNLDGARDWLANVCPALEPPVHGSVCEKCGGEGVVYDDVTDLFAGDWCRCVHGAFFRDRAAHIDCEAFGRHLNGRALAASIDLFPRGALVGIHAPPGLTPLSLLLEEVIVTIMPLDHTKASRLPFVRVRMPEVA